MEMQEHGDYSELFKSALEPDEKLLWSGRPGRGRLLYAVDVIRLALTLPFISLALYFLMPRVFSAQNTYTKYNTVIGMIILVILFLALSFGTLVRRILV
jgi:hypothetical protein